MLSMLWYTCYSSEIMYRLHTLLSDLATERRSPRCATSLYYDYTKFKNQVYK